MKYNYKLTFLEAAGCGFRLGLQRLALRPMVSLGIILVVTGTSMLNWVVSVTAGGAAPAGTTYQYGALGAGLLVCILLWLWVVQTGQVWRRCCREPRSLTLGDGLLTLGGSREVLRYRCRELGIVRRRGSVYWLEAVSPLVPGPPRRWVFLPARVLGGKDGEADFCRMLNEQRKLPGDIPGSLWIKDALGREPVETYHNLNTGLWIIQQRDFSQSLMISAQWNWVCKCFLTGWKKHRYVYKPLTVGAALALVLAAQWLLGVAGWFLAGTGGIPGSAGPWGSPGGIPGSLAGILLGVAAFYYLRLFRSWQQSRRLVPLPMLRSALLRSCPGQESRKGRFQVTADRTGVWRRNLAEDRFWSWKELGWLLETDSRYFLCTRKEDLAACFDKELVGDWMSRKLFVQDCQEQGLVWEQIAPQVIGSCGETEPRPQKQSVAAAWRNMPVDGKDGSGEGNGRIVFTLCATVALAAAALFLPEYGGRGGDYGMVMDVDGEFHPEHYKDYLPLNDQVKVLEELGIQVPEDQVKALRETMDQDQDSRSWIEGYPYYALLTYLGMPEWDEETWKVTRYPEEAFWFDWEAFSLEDSYYDILSSIHAMSGGRCQVTDIQTDTSQVEWEKGTGRITVRCRIGGIAQECTVSVMNDWLDPMFLEYVNRGLKEAGVRERLYAMDDGGQGCILFYRDKAWAKEFTEKTGVRLE